MSLVGITYDSPTQQSRFSRKHKISYPMMSDPESAAIQSLGLLNEEMDPSTQYYGVPYPGVFIVDRTGQITAKFAEESYRDRPLVDDLLKAARQLAEGTSSAH